MELHLWEKKREQFIRATENTHLMVWGSHTQNTYFSLMTSKWVQIDVLYADVYTPLAEPQPRTFGVMVVKCFSNLHCKHSDNDSHPSITGSSWEEAEIAQFENF